MNEKLFVKLLHYLFFLYSNGCFAKNGFFKKRFGYSLPWSINNNFFSDEEKIIIVGFLKNVKFNGKTLFREFSKNYYILFEFYNDTENLLISHYENFTRKRFDRKLLENSDTVFNNKNGFYPKKF